MLLGAPLTPRTFSPPHPPPTPHPTPIRPHPMRGQALSTPTLSLNKQIISMSVAAIMPSNSASASDVLPAAREAVLTSIAQACLSRLTPPNLASPAAPACPTEFCRPAYPLTPPHPTLPPAHHAAQFAATAIHQGA